LTDFDPPVNPPEEIDDPDDAKPADWVDDQTIPDPDAVRPDDWDDDAPEWIPDPDHLTPPEGWLPEVPRLVPDPYAERPDDWDDDTHGEWSPPLVPNPKCGVGCGEYVPPSVRNPLHRGKWQPPRITNPRYKGEWRPRKIPNPTFFVDEVPARFGKIYGAGFESWCINKDVAFGNVYIGTDEQAVAEWNKVHFLPKAEVQRAEKKRETGTESTEL
jgi:calnexin